MINDGCMYESMANKETLFTQEDERFDTLGDYKKRKPVTAGKRRQLLQLNKSSTCNLNTITTPVATPN